ncbi:APC family permease [Casimicrobium huifangae]|uniref:APC family permease n=1 Tax=Casimicrobium huifangae TaxID=2591109 RepID=UPI0012ECABB8|nr:amino acid permease [Casimicrobium huifangae]
MQGIDSVSAIAEVAAAPTGNKLDASLGLWTLTLLGVGATVGTGIFFVMAEAVPKAGPAVIVAFILAAITAGLTALCYAELASSVPASGSSYSYARVAFGDFVAFVVAACLLLEYALAASATAIGWSGYLNNFLDNAFGWSIPEALRSPMLVAGKAGLEVHFNHFNLPPVILVVLCAILLLRGTRESALVNAGMVLLKLLVLVFFAVIAWGGFRSENFTPFFNSSGMTGVTAAAGTVFFSFIGLDTVATAAAETRNPKRTVPLGILLGLLIVTIVYMLVAVTALGAQPAAKFDGQEAGLAEILKTVTGQAWPAVVLSAGAVISVFSVTLVTIYGQTRILYALSIDRLLPPLFQRLGRRAAVPGANTVIVSVVVAIVAGLVDSGYLWDMVSLGTLVAFIVVSMAVPVMRQRAMRSGDIAAASFRVPFGPYLVPALSVLACLYIIKDLSPVTFKVFAVWMVVAVGAFLAYRRLANRGETG